MCTTSFMYHNPLDGLLLSPMLSPDKEVSVIIQEIICLTLLEILVIIMI